MAGWKPAHFAAGSAFPRSRSEIGNTVGGLREVKAVYEALSKGAANRVVKPGLMKGGRIIAKAVKASIPLRHKEIKRLIGVRSVKTKFNAGFASVKVGAAVGTRKQAIVKRSRAKPGVGISATNVHWWFLGTGDRWQGIKRRRMRDGSIRERRTGNPVRYTGFMPQQTESVGAIAMRNQSAIMATLKESIDVGLQKEALRAAKRAMR